MTEVELDHVRGLLKKALEDLNNLEKEHSNLRKAAHNVIEFAIPYWDDDDNKMAIPVSGTALKELRTALYS